MEKQQSGRSSQPVNGFLILHPRENANSKKIRGSASFVLALRSNAIMKRNQGISVFYFSEIRGSASFVLALRSNAIMKDLTPVKDLTPAKCSTPEKC